MSSSFRIKFKLLQLHFQNVLSNCFVLRLKYIIRCNPFFRMKFRLLRLCLPNIVSNGYCKYTKFKLLRLHFTNILNNFFVLQIPNAHFTTILLLQIHHAVPSLLSNQVQVERLHLHHPHPAHRSPLRRAQVRSSNFFIFIEMIVSFIHLHSFY